jgi:hypothetical protein
MNMMSLLTIVKLSVLSLIAMIGILIIIKVIPSDVDASLNLSFYATTTSIGPYASALYYVRHSLLFFFVLLIFF